MITKFNTSSPSATVSTPSKSGGGMGTVLLVGGLLIGGYLAWNYIIKPKMDERKNQTNV